MSKKAPKRATVVQDRVVELRKALPRDVQDHPVNWRVHGDKQKGAMRGLFRELGYVKPVDVYIPQPGDRLVTTGIEVAGECRKLRAGVPCIMDGHLRRAEVPSDFMLSLNVTDLTEDEALKYLATCDPLADMASQDDELLVQLLSQIDSDDKHVQEMLADLVDLGGDDGDAGDGGDGAGDVGKFQIVVDCEGEEEQRTLVERFTLDGLKFRALVG